MTVPSNLLRRRLVAELTAAGALRSPEWTAAFLAVPRERFLRPGIFLPADDGRWRPVTDPVACAAAAHRDESLVTQLDGHRTADRATAPVTGFPTSSSTAPGTVIRMLEALDVTDTTTVLEIGTGTGYSTALLCHRLGDDNVTTIEVDPGVAARADAALEATGHSTWTITGDGLLGHPPRAPYDRTIATCAVRRIPYTWIRQTRPGGTVLATVGTWSYGTGLVRLTVRDDGTADGRVIGRSSFMPTRAHAVPPVSGDLSARAAYADTERRAIIGPDTLAEWTPAFLTQLALPGAQPQTAITQDGRRTVYLFDTDRESFAALTENHTGWTVRQGGPLALWDTVEHTLAAWRSAGHPDIDTIRIHVTAGTHDYAMDGSRDLRWSHRID